MLLAHPLTGSPPLPVPPLLLAAGAVVVAAVVATRVRPARGSSTGPRPEPGWLWAPRLLSAAVLLLLVAAARVGPAEEPRNLAGVAVVHVLWPVLLVLAVLAGPLLWRAVDPWWALGGVERLLGGDPAGAPAPAPARPAEAASEDGVGPPAGAPPDAGPAPPEAGPAPPDAGPAPPRAVWPAVAAACAWAAFLSLHSVSVRPRPLAAALAAYTVVMVAGSLAAGRRRWLPSAEAIGLLTSWAGLVRRGRLVSWVPPPGAAALLGAVFGGVVFARFRLATPYGELALATDPELLRRGGTAVAVLGGAGLAYAAERWAARRGAPGSVAAALVPVVVAAAVGTRLRRLLLAAQLLPGVATDPFGRGWRLLGSWGDPRVVDVNPWGTGVQQGLAVAVVTLGGAAGAWVLARRARGLRARDPAAYTVYVATFLAALVAGSS